MCTVTVLRRPDQVVLTMNRDELRERGAEIEPAIDRRTPHSPLRIAPMDGERKGTWVGVNEHGVAACLLNRYRPDDLEVIGRPETPSRGWIVEELLSLSEDRVDDWLRDELDPTQFPSFTLIAVTAKSGAVLTWERGGTLERRWLSEGWSMETSAFWQADQVQAWRRDAFARWCEGGHRMVAGVPDFNLVRDTSHPEFSPVMTRRRSMTRSITQVKISTRASRVDLRYWHREGERPIDASLPTSELTLPLAGGACR